MPHGRLTPEDPVLLQRLVSSLALRNPLEAFQLLTEMVRTRALSEADYQKVLAGLGQERSRTEERPAPRPSVGLGWLDRLLGVLGAEAGGPGLLDRFASQPPSAFSPRLAQFTQLPPELPGPFPPPDELDPQNFAELASIVNPYGAGWR